MFNLQYMGSIADAKKALIASGLHDSGVLHVDNFTFKHTDYLEAVEESIGEWPACVRKLASWHAAAGNTSATDRLLVALLFNMQASRCRQGLTGLPF